LRHLAAPDLGNLPIGLFERRHDQFRPAQGRVFHARAQTGALGGRPGRPVRKRAQYQTRAQIRTAATRPQSGVSTPESLWPVKTEIERFWDSNH